VLAYVWRLGGGGSIAILATLVILSTFRNNNNFQELNGGIELK